MKKTSITDSLDCGFMRSLVVVEYTLYFIAIAVIITGSMSAFDVLLETQNISYVPSSYKSQQQYFLDIKKARIVIGEALNMSLTFILAADIVKTIRTPDYLQIGKLIILVVLREFIVYSLNLEIKDLRKQINTTTKTFAQGELPLE